MVNRTKKLLKTVFKFVLTGLALYFVFSKISWDQVSELLLGAQPIFLLLATLLFILSKVLSACRLQYFFECIDLKISSIYNLKLYWIGMFYNLFLPGGIGGDGYKVYLLNKQFKVKVKPLVQATLIDRISGLASLLFLGGGGFLFLDLSALPNWIKYADVVGLILLFPSLFIFSKLLFRSFIKELPRAMLWSIGVQLMQVVSVVFILLAIGISEKYLAYSVLFLISSFVSILPFTIGGLGSREITFLLGFHYFGIAETQSIALSLLFTLITALISFGGIFMKVKNPSTSKN